MWTTAERARAAAAARQQTLTELQRKLESARWYLAQSAGCTELTQQRWRDLIAEYERDIAELK